MDADIAAADALGLERIKAQDYRASIASAAAHQAAVRAQWSAFMDWIKAEYAALPDPVTEKRLALALAIADKYFTTGTATLQESIDLDATNDARRFKAAVDAALAVV